MAEHIKAGSPAGIEREQVVIWHPAGKSPEQVRDLQTIENLLRHTIMIDGEDRHPVRLDAIKQGRFSFGLGPAEVTYINLGEGSWNKRFVPRRAHSVY